MRPPLYFLLGLALTFFALAVRTFYLLPWDCWNGLRIEGAVAIARGFPIYSSFKSGPVLPVIYPPLSAIAYLIAGYAHTPESAVYLGGVATFFYTMSPVIYFHFSSFEQKYAEAAWNRVTSLAFFLLTMTFAATRNALYSNHADAPAIFFASLTALCILRFEKDSRRWPVLILAAFTSVLCGFTKQTYAPVILGTTGYLWVAHKKIYAFLYFSICLLFSLGIGLIFCKWFGVHELFYNIIKIPYWHPFDWKRFSIVNELILPISLPIFPLWVLMRITRKNNPFRKEFILLQIFAISLIPTAVLSRLKCGGYPHDYGCVIYFCTLACSLQIKSIFVSPLYSEKVEGVKLGIAGALIFICGWNLSREFFDPANQWRPAVPRLTQAYEIAKLRPGRVFFPLYGLANLFAENRLYHTNCLQDWELAGAVLTRKRVMADLPKTMERIYVETSGDFFLKFLPEFRHEKRDPSGWWLVEWKK